MAIHSSVLAWEIPWTEEPGGLQPMGSQSRTRVKRLNTHTSLRVPSLRPVAQSGPPIPTAPPSLTPSFLPFPRLSDPGPPPLPSAPGSPGARHPRVRYGDSAGGLSASLPSDPNSIAEVGVFLSGEPEPVTVLLKSSLLPDALGPPGAVGFVSTH